MEDYQDDGAGYSMTLNYPRDIWGHRTGTYDQRPRLNWSGWDVYWARVAGQRLNMGGSSAYLAHADAIGTTHMVTDPAGAVVWDAVFGPWGQTLQSGGSRPYAVFASLEWPINEIVYPSATRGYNYRVYRWMTPDPDNAGADLGDSQSWDMYSYVGDNPTTDTDPDGLACVEGANGNWYNDNSGGETCAEAFSAPPETVNVTANAGNGLQAMAMNAFLQLSSMADSLSSRGSLINAQNTAMNNPFYTPGYHGSTWCNYGTCDVAKTTGAPMAALTHPNGVPYPSALIVANLAKPDSGWRDVSAAQAQRLANEGRTVIAAWDHHVSTIRPAGVPGDHLFGAGSHEPWVANVGWKNGVMGINWAFPARVVQAGEVHFYTPGY